MKLRLAVLIAAAVAALMAFAGGAGATSVTTTTGGAAATPTVHFANEVSHVSIDSPVGEIKCNWTLELTITVHGSGVTAAGPLNNLTTTGCTEGWHTTTIAAGSLEIHWTSAHNGTVTWTGSKVSTTAGGITCVYGTSATDIGTLTGGNPATLDIAAKLPIVAAESSIFCGTSAQTLTGSLSTTSALYIAP